MGEGVFVSCRKHYKEYLVDRMNMAALDPLPMYTTAQIALILTREEKEVPDKEDDDDEAYREKLIEVWLTRTHTCTHSPFLPSRHSPNSM